MVPNVGSENLWIDGDMTQRKTRRDVCRLGLIKGQERRTEGCRNQVHKGVLEKELLEGDALCRFWRHCSTLLHTLDKSILAICPTEEIEGGILEAEYLTDKIAQLRLEISLVIVPKVYISGAKSTEVVNKLKETCESTETHEQTVCIKTGTAGDSELE